MTGPRAVPCRAVPAAVFVESNKDLLATIPPPQVAVQYYKAADLYLFDE